MVRAFVDASIAIHATGNDTVLREMCLNVFRFGARTRGSLVTDAEVLQEVLHVLTRRGDSERAIAALSLFEIGMRRSIEPVTGADVFGAARSVLAFLQVRDRVHLAVMARLGITRIVTTDRGFDRVASVQRLDPGELTDWAPDVFG